MDNKSKNGTPPPALVEDNAEAAPRSRRERGYTLQTLIVTAVLVLVAAGVAVVLWAVTRGASDRTESAGRVSVETWCSSNEVRDPDLLDVKGTNRILNHEITSHRIGCRPVCGTWEYYDPGLAAGGVGGPQGSNGVYSSDIGCFAPCYWSHNLSTSDWRPRHDDAINELSKLSYHDDDRPPGINQIRLGVNYRRRPASELDLSAVTQLELQLAQDIGYVSTGVNVRSMDGNPFIFTHRDGGNRVNAGELPLHSKQIADGAPTVFKPNWVSGRVGFRDGLPDPGVENREGTHWEDENWEYRADRHREVCTIVNIVTDEIVCSSEWENCGLSGRRS